MVLSWHLDMIYKQEKTGFRNEHFMLRRREQGFYLFDIDGTMFTKNAEPKCMIEDKMGYIKTIDLNSFQFRCLTNMAKKCDLPLFCVVNYIFGPDGKLLEAGAPHVVQHCQYFVIPINDLAKKAMGPIPKCMTEIAYLQLMNTVVGESSAVLKIASDDWRVVKLPIVS